jgi:hypothetical protein
MTVTRGDEHVFLGMRICYNKVDGTATVSMKDYLREAIEESGMKIERCVTTPANKEMFDIDETAKYFDKRDAEVFHRIVAKLLYVSTRARMDLLFGCWFPLHSRLKKYTHKTRRNLEDC